MDNVDNWIPNLAIIDLIAMGLLAMGVIMGLMRGLGPAFGMFLWLLVALWLSTVLTPVILDWMPNSSGDVTAQLTAYGVVASVLLLLPALARLLGGAGGKKKKDPEATYRPFGVLIGLLSAMLFFTLLAPYAYRVSFVSKNFGEGNFPSLAVYVSENVNWLFHDSHRSALTATVKTAQRHAEARTRDDSGK